ncbi:hypothetical protein HK102_000987, partial [Quaeritorhiza haematococci]
MVSVTSLPPEILRLIFTFFTPSTAFDPADAIGFETQHAKQLRSCSRVCKKFADIAIPLLWQGLSLGSRKRGPNWDLAFRNFLVYGGKGKKTEDLELEGDQPSKGPANGKGKQPGPRRHAFDYAKYLRRVTITVDLHRLHIWGLSHSSVGIRPWAYRSSTSTTPSTSASSETPSAQEKTPTSWLAAIEEILELVKPQLDTLRIFVRCWSAEDTQLLQSSFSMFAKYASGVRELAISVPGGSEGADERDLIPALMRFVSQPVPSNQGGSNLVLHDARQTNGGTSTSRGAAGKSGCFTSGTSVSPLPKLRKLALCGGGITKDVLKAFSICIPHLTHLRLQWIDDETSDDLTEDGQPDEDLSVLLFSKATNLISLALDSCDEFLTRRGLLTLTQSASRSLRVLRLCQSASEYLSTETWDEALSHCPRLEEFTWWEGEGDDDDEDESESDEEDGGEAGGNGGPSVNADTIPKPSVTGDVLFALLSRCHSLRILELGALSEVGSNLLQPTDPDHFKRYQNWAENLTELTLCSLKRLPDSFLSSLALASHLGERKSKSGLGFKELYIRKCPQITNKTVVEVLKGCRRLQKIEISWVGSGGKEFAELARVREEETQDHDGDEEKDAGEDEIEDNIITAVSRYCSKTIEDCFFCTEVSPCVLRMVFAKCTARNAGETHIPNHEEMLQNSSLIPPGAPSNRSITIPPGSQIPLVLPPRSVLNLVLQCQKLKKLTVAVERDYRTEPLTNSSTTNGPANQQHNREVDVHSERDNRIATALAGLEQYDEKYLVAVRFESEASDMGSQTSTFPTSELPPPSIPHGPNSTEGTNASSASVSEVPKPASITAPSAPFDSSSSSSAAVYPIMSSNALFKLQMAEMQAFEELFGESRDHPSYWQTVLDVKGGLRNMRKDA